MSDEADAIVISRHALRRYRQRRCRIPLRAAKQRIQKCLQTGTITARPPDDFAIEADGTSRYCYSPADPELCLILSGDCVVTVYTARSCRRWAIDAVEGRRQRRPGTRGSHTRGRRP